MQLFVLLQNTKFELSCNALLDFDVEYPWGKVLKD